MVRATCWSRFAVRMIGNRREKLEHQEGFRWSQSAPSPEDLHQRRPIHDFLDKKTLLSGTLERINFLQLRPRRATELVDLLLQRSVPFAVG